jgi:cell wall-associated NlpC family hydrolase
MLTNHSGAPRAARAVIAAMLTLSLVVGCGTSIPIQQPQRSEPVATTLQTAGPVPGPVLAPMPEATPNTIDTPLAVMRYGDEIALRAISLVGKPYRYGGADLQGFDCSGMVYFIHQALGIEVPRTAADQQRAAMSVDRAALQPGDLLFFRTTRAKRTSHVGVYVGENRFVHAPQSGKLIELRTLDDQYYGKHLVGTGRLYPNS